MQKTEARGARRCGLGPRMALRRPAAAFPAPSSESDCILLSPQPPSPPPLLPPYIPLSPPCPSRRRSATSLPSLLLSPPWPAPSMRCPLPSRLAPAAATSARERSDPLGTRLSKTPANERGRLIWRPSHRLPSRASVVLLEPEHGRKDPRYVAPSTNPCSPRYLICRTSPPRAGLALALTSRLFARPRLTEPRTPTEQQRLHPRVALVPQHLVRPPVEAAARSCLPSSCFSRADPDGPVAPSPSSRFNAMRDEDRFARKTSIIATIGPKVNNPQRLQELREAGMNIGAFPLLSSKNAPRPSLSAGRRALFPFVSSPSRLGVYHPPPHPCYPPHQCGFEAACPFWSHDASQQGGRKREARSGRRMDLAPSSTNLADVVSFLH